eukprot:9383434-Alexandrium_andersonii.AAC.1
MVEQTVEGHVPAAVNQHRHNHNHVEQTVDVEVSLQRGEIDQVHEATVQERLVQQMVEQAVGAPVPITEEEIAR